MSDGKQSDTAKGWLPTADNLSLGGLLSIDEAVFQRSFALILTVFVVVIVSLSLTYSREARLFPLIVGVPTLILLFTLFLVETVPSVSAFARSLKSASIIDTDSLEDAGMESGANTPIETIRSNAVRTLGWILLLTVSILLFGHVIGLTLSLAFVFRYYSSLSWVRAIIFSLVNVAFLSGLFMVAFNAELYPGILFG